MIIFDRNGRSVLYHIKQYGFFKSLRNSFPVVTIFIYEIMLSKAPEFDV